MKKEEIKKWRESTKEEIQQSIDDMEKQLYKSVHQLHIGQLKNYSTISSTKKNIAVLNTLLSEKKREKKIKP